MSNKMVKVTIPFKSAAKFIKGELSGYMLISTDNDYRLSYIAGYTQDPKTQEIIANIEQYDIKATDKLKDYFELSKISPVPTTDDKSIVRSVKQSIIDSASTDEGFAIAAECYKTIVSYANSANMVVANNTNTRFKIGDLK